MSAPHSLRDLLYSSEWLKEVETAPGPGKVSQDQLYGVVVEVGLDEGAVTIAGFANGDARLLYSTGGGLIGSLSIYPEVARAAATLCKVGQQMLEAFPEESQVPPLPQAGIARFALLTPGGRRATEVPIGDVTQPGHPVYTLFTAATNLLTKLNDVQNELDQAAGKQQPTK
jgi:hypothetical protein